jgi:hypothetical protein
MRNPGKSFTAEAQRTLRKEKTGTHYHREQREGTETTEKATADQPNI